MTTAPRRVFVTGALGFIGRTLADRYRAAGAEVRGMDRVAAPEHGVVAGDVSEPGDWQAHAAGSDLVIITGRGKHSEDGAALLRPAVLEMLAQPEYAVLDAAIDPSNEGCVRVPAARLVCWSLDERTKNPAEAGGDE